MLPPRARLRGKQALERVQRSRAVVRSSLLTLRIVRRGDLRGPRVAIAVGRHVSTRAVDRNRVARWLREGMRQELPRLEDGVDLRISAAAPFARYSFPACADDLSTLLARARLVRRMVSTT